MSTKESATILFVDDDKRVLKSLKMLFTNEGFNCLIAANGNEALDVVIGNQVDVAVVDFRIGKEDGITVAQRLKEVDEDLKIIIFTGFPSYETAVQAMKIGAFDYLSKASPNEKVMSIIRKAITERGADRVLKKKDGNGDRRVKMVLFCSHSLITETLENFSRTSSAFKMVKSFSSLDAYGIKNISQEIHIALLCSGCTIKCLKDAYSVLPELYRSFPGVKVVLINESFSDTEKVELLKLGVRGFVSPDSSSDKLEKALHHIANGEIWVSRVVTQLSLNNISNYDIKSAHKLKEIFGLTEREIEILTSMTQGLKNKDIAEQLVISETTVKTHVNRIFKKMGVDNRTKAILAVIENKLA